MSLLGLLELGLLDAPLLELGGVAELDELELGLDGDLSIELELEDEPDGEDGVVAEEDDDPVEDRSRAPGPVFGPLSQPYRPLTATAIGSAINAALFSKLI